MEEEWSGEQLLGSGVLHSTPLNRQKHIGTETSIVCAQWVFPRKGEPSNTCLHTPKAHITKIHINTYRDRHTDAKNTPTENANIQKHTHMQCKTKD